MGLEINKFQWLNQNKYKFLISNTYNFFVLNIYIHQNIIAKWTIFILTTSDIKCVGFLLHQHQLGVQEFSSILTLPVRPTVKVSVLQDCPHSICQSHVARPPILLTDEQISQGFYYDLSKPFSGLTSCCCCCHVTSVVLTLCDHIDGSPPGSSVPGILHTRTLELVAISFFNTWKWKVKVKSLSWVRLFMTPWTVAHQAPPPMGFSRQEYWSGSPLPSPDNLLEYLKELCVLSCVQLFVTQWTVAHQVPLSLGFSSVQFSCSVMSNSLQPHGLQQARLPCQSPTPRVCSN